MMAMSLHQPQVLLFAVMSTVRGRLSMHPLEAGKLEAGGLWGHRLEAAWGTCCSHRLDRGSDMWMGLGNLDRISLVDVDLASTIILLGIGLYTIKLNSLTR